MERRYTTVTTVTTVTVAGVRYRIFNFTSEHESGYAAADQHDLRHPLALDGEGAEF